MTTLPPVEAFRSFDVGGYFLSAEAYGRGHIHDTYLVTVIDDDREGRFLLQRLNTFVFPDPAALMENVRRVTEHLRAKGHEGLRLRATKEGDSHHRDGDGGTWRVYEFLDGTRSFRSTADPERARAAAAAFGRFQKDLLDLPGPPLAETIPGFHDTPARYRALHAAVETDAVNRAATAAEEIDFALAREPEEMGTFMISRVVHYDAKLDNVLFDAASGAVRCVVDLDTVMPGVAAFDFGDLVRSTVSPTPEAATDLDAIEVREDLFAALADGYLGVMGDVLTEEERDQLPEAGRLITLETGARFLTDYLEGDVYFPAPQLERNLERARAQFRLVERLEEKAEVLRRILRAT